MLLDESIACFAEDLQGIACLHKFKIPSFQVQLHRWHYRDPNLDILNGW